MKREHADVNYYENTDVILKKDSKTYLALKRVIDIVGSIAALIVLLPLLLIVMLLVKLDSKGPALFVQKRYGKDGKLFNMYKFRSMCMDAEEKLEQIQHMNEADGLMFKIKADPRLTRLGRFIRRTSIDELPQLLNVLKGEMSLVGPRPPLPNEVEKYSERHKLRLTVKPGLTGLWQISGRSNLGFEDMVRLDLKYITERNLFYDLKIIIKTVPVVFKSYGAY